MMNNNIANIISECKQRLDDAGGLKRVFFVACGGSQAAIFPGFYFLQKEALGFGVSIHNSSEFLYDTPKGVNKNALCICCSLKATKETVEAVIKAKAEGAVTIAMTGNTDTEMAKNGDYAVIYSNGDNQIYSESNQSNVLRISFEILKAFEGYPYYDEAMSVFDKIDELVRTGKEKTLGFANDCANRFKDNDLFYVLASGSMYASAYTMACCHLMEMQWKHTVFLNSGEYFHGPFETTDRKTPVILLKSIGATRILDERAETFLKRHTDNLMVLDAQDLGMNELPESVREYFNPVVMIPIERAFVSRFAEYTGHSMDYRRYMWKEDY